MTSLRNIMLTKKLTKVCFKKDEDVKALSKMWVGPPITECHKEMVLQGSFQYIEDFVVDQNIISDLSVSEQTYLYEDQICELARISLAILVNHLISVKLKDSSSPAPVGLELNSPVNPDNLSSDTVASLEHTFPEPSQEFSSISTEQSKSADRENPSPKPQTDSSKNQLAFQKQFILFCLDSTSRNLEPILVHHNFNCTLLDLETDIGKYSQHN